MTMQTALVTGAAGAIGTGICMQIAERGLQIVLVDRDRRKSATLAEQLTRRFPAVKPAIFPVDLSSHADIRRLCNEVRAAYPKLEYLFLNAGVLPETLIMSAQGNELDFEVNTLAPLQLIDGLRPSLAAASKSCIVATTAGISLSVTDLDWQTLIKPTTFSKLFGPYTRSKQALNVLVTALANELGSDGIAIRAADPGPTKSALTKGGGTPLWMRLFYMLLPGPAAAARKITDAAFGSRWQTVSGGIVVGGRVKPLPPSLGTKEFQQEFLQRARAHVASASDTSAVGAKI